jgi:hypothetical protein
MNWLLLLNCNRGMKPDADPETKVWLRKVNTLIVSLIGISPLHFLKPSGYFASPGFSISSHRVHLRVAQVSQKNSDFCPITTLTDCFFFNLMVF